MDQLEPFKVFLLEGLDFAPNFYEVYQGGSMIDHGCTSMKISVRSNNKYEVCQDNIRLFIQNNNLSSILDSTALFDMVMTLHDRFIAVILPKHSNIDDIMFSTFKRGEFLLMGSS